MECLGNQEKGQATGEMERNERQGVCVCVVIKAMMMLMKEHSILKTIYNAEKENIICQHP